jgi:hypothetical protein
MLSPETEMSVKVTMNADALGSVPALLLMKNRL